MTASTARIAASMVHTTRAYEAAARSDGDRVLVDRLWPRGVTKDALALDLWAKERAASAELRRWAKGRVTIVYSARDERHNNAAVVRDEIARRLRTPTARSARRGAA